MQRASGTCCMWPSLGGVCSAQPCHNAASVPHRPLAGFRVLQRVRTDAGLVAEHSGYGNGGSLAAGGAVAGRGDLPAAAGAAYYRPADQVGGVPHARCSALIFELTIHKFVVGGQGLATAHLASEADMPELRGGRHMRTRGTPVWHCTMPHLRNTRPHWMTGCSALLDTHAMLLKICPTPGDAACSRGTFRCGVAAPRCCLWTRRTSTATATAPSAAKSW